MATLVVIWASVYAPHIFLFDPSWLLNLPNALFFCLSLIAHTLSRVSFIRFYHPTGLSGSVTTQERVVIQTILASSVSFLLLVLVIGSIFVGKSSVLTTVQGWLAWTLQTLAQLFRSVGLFRLVPQPRPSTCHPSIHIHCPQPTPPPQIRPTVTLPTLPSVPKSPLFNYLSPQMAAILAIILVALLISAVLLVLILVVRRSLKHRNRSSGEIHESVWSWTLFWSQCKAFFRALQLRLFSRFSWLHARHNNQLLSTKEESVAPTARNIREIYSALLTNAAKLGHPRSQNETPHEFGSRLAQQLPFVEPQLSLITEVYTLTRYGGFVPNEAEVTRLRDLLLALKQKGLR